MLRIIYIIFILLSLNCYKSKLYAQKKPTKQLKVLTWNVYELPFFINNTKRVERAKGIVEVLKQTDYDAIVLQETYHKKSFQIIEEGLKQTFPYHIKTDRARTLLKHHHGLFIVSKLPAKVLGAITYKYCRGLDCLSKKGAILIEIEKDGQSFQILDTHLQSGNKNNQEAIRKSQRHQITNFLNQHKTNNVPQLLCGDFNTNYNNLALRDDLLNDLEIVDATVPTEDTWPNKFFFTKKNHATIVDYIFMKPNNFEGKTILTKVHYFYNEKLKTALSDHAAIEMLLMW